MVIGYWVRILCVFLLDTWRRFNERTNKIIKKKTIYANLEYLQNAIMNIDTRHTRARCMIIALLRGVEWYLFQSIRVRIFYENTKVVTRQRELRIVFVSDGQLMNRRGIIKTVELIDKINTNVHTNDMMAKLETSK